jgi:hypothetical protein
VEFGNFGKRRCVTMEFGNLEKEDCSAVKFGDALFKVLPP